MRSFNGGLSRPGWGRLARKGPVEALYALEPQRGLAATQATFCGQLVGKVRSEGLRALDVASDVTGPTPLRDK